MVTVVGAPNTQERIDSIWAVLSVDPETGREGLCGTKVGHGWMSLMTADPDKVDIIRQLGAEIAEGSDHKTRLVRFTSREDVAEL